MGAPVDPSIPADISEAPPHIQAAIRAYAAFNDRVFDAASLATAAGREPRQPAASLQRILAAFPDLRVSRLRASDLGEGRVAVRYLVSGTNTGPMHGGHAATGRHVMVEVTDVLDFDASGRLVDASRDLDVATVRRQLGLADG